MSADRMVAEPEDAIVVEGRNSLILTTPVMMDTDDRATDWSVTDKLVLAPDRAFLRGRYVHGGPPANRNGHLFDTDELVDAHKRVPFSPLNMLHRIHHVIGAFVKADMVYPAGHGLVVPDDRVSVNAEDPLTAAFGPKATDLLPTAHSFRDAPYVDAISVLWKYAFPNEYQDIKAAHDAGSCWLSMEAVPQSVKCPTCAAVADYQGAQHDTYCEHMNVARGPKWLLKPSFVGGAVVLPPARPGWKDADVTELAGYVEAHPDQAEQVYERLAADAPHLESREVEAVMAVLIANAHRDEHLDPRKVIAPLWESLTDGYEHINFVPPAEVQHHVQVALASVGSIGDIDHHVDQSLIARSTATANGQPRSPAAIRRMAEGLMEGGPEYDLWGGDPGLEWVTVVLAQMALADAELDDMAADADSNPFRMMLAKKNHALPDGSFPIPDVAHLRKAIKAFGRAKDKAKAKAHIIKRAKALKVLRLVPDAWTSAKDFDVDRGGVVIVLRPPHNVAAALAAAGTEDAEQIHVTVAFLGAVDGAGTSVSDDDNTATHKHVTEVVKAFAKTVKPLHVAVDGVGRFDEPDGTICTYAKIVSDRIQELHSGLSKALVDAGIPLSTKHPAYQPHATIAYTPKDEGPDSVPKDLKWDANYLELWWGTTKPEVYKFGDAQQQDPKDPVVPR